MKISNTYCKITWWAPYLKSSPKFNYHISGRLLYLLQSEYQVENLNDALCIIDSRSHALNSLIFSNIKDKWLIIHHPSVEIIDQNLWFPKRDDIWLIYSDGIDWKGSKIKFNPQHFAYVIRRLRAIPFDITMDDSSAIIANIQLIFNRYKYNKFKTKKPLWKIKDLSQFR